METIFDNIAETHSIIARQRVLTDLKLLIRDADALLKATAHDAGEKSQEVRARVIAALERAKAIASELEQQALTYGKAVARQTDLVIREQPYHSLGVAFGLGLLLGVLAMGCNRNVPG